MPAVREVIRHSITVYLIIVSAISLSNATKIPSTSFIIQPCQHGISKTQQRQHIPRRSWIPTAPNSIALSSTLPTSFTHRKGAATKTFYITATAAAADNENSETGTNPSFTAPTNKGMKRAAFIQCGSGCCHGRNPTKAAIRACRDAIEFNSLKVSTVIPGGYDAMKIHVQIGVPFHREVNVEQIVKEVFPYGTVIGVLIEEGGLLGSNTVVLPGRGLEKDDMTLAVACVTVGYD